MEWLFSGDIAPGSKVAERTLARELGIGRGAARELIRDLVARGLLVGGEKWEGVRTRAYTTAEVQHLSELRESLEVGSARSAAVNATETDLTRMEMICDESDAVIDECSAERWAQLEHHFHSAVAEASHNERLIRGMNHLLTECHYVFFVSLKSLREQRHVNRPHSAKEHRALVEAIRARDVDRADKIVRDHIWVTGLQTTREMIALSLEK
jgi:DNA-binding GntR family transcriptional regulator